VAVIRVLLACHEGLLRGALAHVLTGTGDLQVVGEVDRADALGRAVREARPDVTIVELDLLGRGRGGVPGDPGGPGRLLVMVEPRRAAALVAAVRRPPAAIGLLTSDSTPQHLVAAVRRLAAGESVVDADVHARGPGPLTPRESEVLGLAADGRPVREIAHDLGLSPGTVRHHLSRATTKVGARTRGEAVRIARAAGWI
jgi:two-component system, NarL family, response regulator DesR